MQRATTPIARRSGSSESRPVSRAPRNAPGIAAAEPTRRCPLEPALGQMADRPAIPSRKPTTRFVPTACVAGRPTARSSAGIRSVPRMTPTRLRAGRSRTPETPPAGAEPRPRARAGRRPQAEQIDPAADEDGRDRRADARSRHDASEQAADEAPATDGGAIQATRRQSTAPRGVRDRGRGRRDAPSRDVRPARGAGSRRAGAITGRRSVPSTRPTRPGSRHERAASDEEPAQAASLDARRAAAAPCHRIVTATRPASRAALAAGGRVRGPGEDEEQVGEPVQVRRARAG